MVCLKQIAVTDSPCLVACLLMGECTNRRVFYYELKRNKGNGRI
nr:MAG TPA: hypothetical protein [Caudoviricetes sp.]